MRSTTHYYRKVVTRNAIHKRDNHSVLFDLMAGVSSASDVAVENNLRTYSVSHSNSISNYSQ